LFAHDIFVFTPKGDLITMPQGSTALDFAFEIHTQIGMKCIGAKINHKLVPLSHVLQTGDQVEILTSNIQEPSYDWLNFVKTHRAKANIKNFLKEKAQELSARGQEKLQAILRQLNVGMDEHLLLFLQNRLGTTTLLEFYQKLSEGQISPEDIKKSIKQRGKNKKEISTKATENFEAFINSNKGVNDDLLVLDDTISRLEYRLASCCHPIPGDNIFGFIGTDYIEVHRVNCDHAPSLLAKFGYKVVKSKWGSSQEILFLVGIRVEGIDEIGIIQGITKVVTSDFKINMRSMKIFSHDGTFDGTIFLYAKDTGIINQIIRKLIQVKGVHHAERVDAEEM
jgi:GTP pyrophosphokinase